MSATLLVVRHGSAGDRERWEGPDERRPLTGKGRRQAAGLVELLDGFGVERILSSHYVRCLETVVPLACARRLSIETDRALAEGNGDLLLEALPSLAGTLVLCTHGDVVYDLLSLLRWRLSTDGLPMAKGSTWVLDTSDNRARYLPPPP